MRWLAQCVEKGMQVGVNSCKFRTKCYIVYSITRPKLILSPQKRVSIYHTKLYILLQEAQLMEENQRLKQVISLFVVSFFCFFLFMYDISLLIKKKMYLHRWRIFLAFKHTYLNKVSHLSQSPIFAVYLILLKTMTAQRLLSGWGK